MIFVTVFLLLLLLSLSNFSLGNKKIYNIFLFFFGVIFVGLSTIREESGADYGEYEGMFKALSEDYYPFITEPVFSLGIFLIGKFTDNFHFFLFIVSLIAVSLKFRFIKIYSPYIIFSVLIYFCSNYITQDLGQIRQGLAMGFTFTALDFFIQKRFKSYYILSLLAIFTHYSAAVFLFVPLLNRINLNLFIKIGSWVFAFFIAILFKKYSSILYGLDSLLGAGYLLDKLSYIDNKEYNQQAGFGLGMFFRLIVLILASITLLDNKNKLSNKEYNNYSLLINLYYFGGFIYFLFSFIEIFSGRLSIYFTLMEIILLPFILKHSNQIFIKILLFILFLIFSFYSLIEAVFYSENNYLDPFKIIL